MGEILEKVKKVHTIPICQLPIGSHFTMNNSNIKGELVICNEDGDAKVKLFKGIKNETFWWSRESSVIPITSEEFSKAEVIAQETQIETPKKLKEEHVNPTQKVSLGKDRFGCQIGKAPGKINAALLTSPQTIIEIAKKAGVNVGRAQTHIDYWIKKGKGIGPHIKEENGKYSLKS